MKLTSKDALKMLEEAKGKTPDDGWVNHSICVGKTAGKIAEALRLDIDFAKTLGYIHDIGKLIKFKGHVIEGYYYLKKLGYDDEYCNVCLTHSYLNNDVNCTQGEPDDVPFRSEFIKNHEYSIYEKIINLCDLMCTNKVVTMEKRLIDVISRRPQHKNITYHVNEALKLKKYFDDLLGYNLYDLFPEIKENL